jgi:hypothetical protein
MGRPVLARRESDGGWTIDVGPDFWLVAADSTPDAARETLIDFQQATGTSDGDLVFEGLEEQRAFEMRFGGPGSSGSW